MRVRSLPTWVERGNVVRVDDHVTNVIRDIQAISDRIEVYWNDVGEEFDLVEHCLDGNWRLIFSVPELNGRVVERLRRADHWRGNDVPTHRLGEDEDYVAQMDRHNEEMERKRSEETAEKVRYAGEEIAWALDVVNDRPSVGGSISVPKDPDG